MGRPLPGHRGGRRWRAARTAGPLSATARRGRRARTSRASWPCGRAGRRCSAATSHDEERYRSVLRRRLVPDRRPRPARRRRLLLVRRPRRRRDQVRRPPDRPVRGRERADGAPGGRRGRRDRHARPGGRRGRQGVRRAASRASSPSETLRRELLGFARQRLGAAVAPQEIAFADTLPQDAQRQDHAPPAARPASSGLPEGDLSTLEATHDRRPPPSVACDRPTSHGADLLRQMLRIRRFEERCVELYSATKIRGFLHLYIGEEAVAVGVHAGARPRGRGRRHLPRARPRAGCAACRRRRSWPRCSASARAAAAAAAARCTCSTRARRFYGGNAIVGGGLPLAVGLALADQHAAAATASPPASSARARWPRASSTSR